MSEDAEIEHRAVETLALAVNYLTNHSARSHTGGEKNIKPLTEHLHDIFLGRPFFLIHYLYFHAQTIICALLSFHLINRFTIIETFS